VTVTRLVGGLTPGDGSDPRTFPAIWNATADVIDDIRRGYVFVETVYFTSSGTFSKADYPWLRAIRVKCQAGGGGGAGGDGTSLRGGGGGGGGAYAESFITDISGLDSSVTVTRGAGGAGGAATGAAATAGTMGGSSSFGTIVSADGGNNAPASSAGADVQLTGTGDLIVSGSSGGSGGQNIPVDANQSGHGGASFLGGGGRSFPAASLTSSTNNDAGLYGGGGGGARIGTTGRAGGAGANGIVIVELYA
jgi:hypothetical protein